MARTKKKPSGRPKSLPKPSLGQPTVKPSVFVPGRDQIEEDEQLQYDPTAYDCMSTMSLEWPCLSFDIIPDQLGDNRRDFPHTLYLVAGTQAAKPKLNYLAVMKVSSLTKGKHGEERERAERQRRKNKEGESDEEMLDSEDDGSDSEEEEKEDAVLHVRKIAHMGGMNRIRAMPQQPHIIASWADTAQVQIWDVSKQLNELAAATDPSSSTNTSKITKLNARQVHTHSSEGYAVDWSPRVAGRLATGDCRSKIHLWEPVNGAKWQVSAALKGHEGSVEDIQWSPSEETVFASASVDKSIRIWDTRDTSRAMLTVAAHDSDVNVISWNRMTAYMLASGGDDGVLKIWDLRTFSSNSSGDDATNTAPSPVAHFSHHRGPITSVEWCPYESSMLSTTSSDNTLGIWDLALERDPEEEAALAPEGVAAAPSDLPPQLLFLHAGQNDLKEAHWHAQIPGMMVSTAADGFNLFKPYNV